jgi:hypothetical protein
LIFVMQAVVLHAHLLLLSKARMGWRANPFNPAASLSFKG